MKKQIGGYTIEKIFKPNYGVIRIDGHDLILHNQDKSWRYFESWKWFMFSLYLNKSYRDAFENMQKSWAESYFQYWERRKEIAIPLENKNGFKIAEVHFYGNEGLEIEFFKKGFFEEG